MTVENINISVRFFAILREIVGTSKISIQIINGNSVRDVIKSVTTKYQGLHQHLYANDMVNSQFIYILNGENVPSLDIVVKDKDQLAILPPSGGGIANPCSPKCLKSVNRI